MREIVAATPEHLTLLCKELDYLPAPNLKGIALLVDGEPVIVIGYDCWTDGSVSMHQWAKHPKYFGREILRESFRYAFEIGDKRVAIAVVRSDNPRALAVDMKIGFKPQTVIPDAYGLGVDMHILTLKRDECRWYKSNGRK